jgi:hypothetical protein
MRTDQRVVTEISSAPPASPATATTLTSPTPGVVLLLHLGLQRGVDVLRSVLKEPKGTVTCSSQALGGPTPRRPVARGRDPDLVGATGTLR